MKHTSKMTRSPTEYFMQNIWVSADPVERMFPAIVRFAGDDRFFVGSDYPHAEGFVEPVRQTRECLSSLPAESLDKILCVNASSTASHSSRQPPGAPN
jgi:predicted TIM-barrel fold metal-dependent hydrolase